MDDFFEILIFCFLMPVLLFVLIFSLISLADDSNENEQKEKQDKRYELCLKNHKDWVDGDCVTPVK